MFTIFLHDSIQQSFIKKNPLSLPSFYTPTLTPYLYTNPPFTSVKRQKIRGHIYTGHNIFLLVKKYYVFSLLKYTKMVTKSIRNRNLYKGYHYKMSP